MEKSNNSLPQSKQPLRKSALSDTKPESNSQVKNSFRPLGNKNKTKLNNQAVNSSPKSISNHDLKILLSELLSKAGMDMGDLKEAPQKTSVKRPTDTSSRNEYLGKSVSILAHQEIAPPANATKDTQTSATTNTKEHKEEFTEKAQTTKTRKRSKKGSKALEAYEEEFGESKSSKSGGFFYYFGIAALFLIPALILLGGSMLTSTSYNPEAPSTRITTAEGLPTQSVSKPKTINRHSIPADNIIVTEAKTVAEQFLATDGIKYAYAFIAQNKSLGKVFQKYWKPIEEYDPNLLEFKKAVCINENENWVFFEYGKLGSERQIVLTQEQEQPFKIDWKSYSEIETISLQDVIADKSITPHLIRAWIKPGETTYLYSNLHWQNYTAYDLTGNTIDAFVPLSTSSSIKLYDKLITSAESHPSGGEGGIYAVLLVRKPTVRARHLEILDVQATSWHKGFFDTSENKDIEDFLTNQ